MPSDKGVDDGAVWTISRKAGGVIARRETPERLLDPDLVRRLKEWVRA